MNEEVRDEIAKYMALTDEELLVAMGRTLLGENLGFGPDDLERCRRVAIRWLEERHGEIRASLCGLSVVSRLLEEDRRDEMLEATTVVDSLAACFGKPPAASLSLILVRRGLRTLCAED